MTRMRRRDPTTRSTWGRGRGGEQAATRSRDPYALAVLRSVANPGFEFMVCRSKNVLYNLVNALYQVSNNCKINNNSVVTYFGIFSRVYGIIPSILLQHTCVQIIKYTTYVSVWFSFYINTYKYTCTYGNCRVCRGSFV
jgi:hypothetical protein